MATENPIIYSESILMLAAKYDMAVDKVYDILNLRSLGLESSHASDWYGNPTKTYVKNGCETFNFALKASNDNNSQYKKVV